MKSLWVTDRTAIGDRRFEEMLRRLAGAPELSVQLREPPGSDKQCLEQACRARKTLGPEVPLHVNRRFDIALAAGASGVHLPADGLPPGRVRAVTPRGFRIGVSTHSALEAEAAIESGVDLVVLGPIFDTPSKRAFGAPLGVAVLAQLPARESHDSAVFAIGGIDEASLPALEPYRDRISGIAAVRLFQEALDPRGVVERIAAR